MDKKKAEVSIRRDFKSMQPIQVDEVQLSLDKICYGTINSCEVKGFIVSDKYIPVSKSWIEVLMILIDTVIENSKTVCEYKNTFMKYKVTSPTFNIDSKYGIVSLDPNRQYKVFQVYNRKIYLETLLQVSDIFQAIIGLAQACGYTLDKFKIDLVSKEYYEKINDFYLLDDSQIISDISGWTLVQSESVQVEEFLIFSERVVSPSFRVGAWMFMSKLLEDTNDAEHIIEKLPNNSKVSIESNTGQVEDANFTPLKGNKYLMKLDLSDDEIVNYIRTIMRTFNIEESNFQIKVRREQITSNYC